MPPSLAPTLRPSLSAVRGCLLGGALGDALGYPLEFEESVAAILATRGRTAPRDLHVGAEPAVVSDDTQMTLFVTEGLITARREGGEPSVPEIVRSVRSALLRWRSTQDAHRLPPAVADDGGLVSEPRLHHLRAPGTTCMTALAALVGNNDVPTVEHPPNDRKGCGAIMRSAPIGLAAGSRELAFRLGCDCGVLTHGHPSGYLSAAVLAAVIFDVARGVELADAMALAEGLLRMEPGHEEVTRVLARVRDAARHGPPSPEAVEALGGGWTGEEALSIALLCALTADGSGADGIADALWRSVAHPGDSDSTASVAGNLLGAMYGVERLPPRWVQQVELRDVIERVAGELYAS